MSGGEIAQAEHARSGFREVLELAGLDRQEISQFSGKEALNEADWQLIVQLLHRLAQYPASQLDAWVTDEPLIVLAQQPSESVGTLVKISGSVTSAELLVVPVRLGGELHNLRFLHRCQFQLSDSAHSGVVITSKIPREWMDAVVLREPVNLRGIVLQTHSEDAAASTFVLLTDRLSWYPVEGASSGKLLLARQDMDVALLDEVIHRQPFVRLETSREGEAFYACLTAISRADRLDLLTLAKENVDVVVQRWQRKAVGFQKENEILEKELSATKEKVERARLQRQIESARRNRSIAEVVFRQGEKGLSSLAPLFLEPEQETGELVRLEGTARRAIKILVDDHPKIDGYYEMEIFTSESRYLQNQPVVCCVPQLPKGFPTGDAIREPVRIAGVFFKSWRYRSRELAESGGETKRAQPLYTPLVVGAIPTWLDQSVSQSSPWGLGLGVGFLIALAVVWVTVARLARSDRQVRATLRRTDRIDL